MHPELEKLIDLTLTDAVINEKERAVIYAKAKELDVSIDEAEVYIEAKQQKLNQQKEPSKCPACGNLLSGLIKICICGYMLDSGKPNELNTLEGAIEKLEQLIIEVCGIQSKKPSKEIELLSARIDKEIRFIEARYGEDGHIKKLLFELKEKASSHINQKQQKERIKKIVMLTVFVICITIIALNAIFRKNKTNHTFLKYQQTPNYSKTFPGKSVINSVHLSIN